MQPETNGQGRGGRFEGRRMGPWVANVRERQFPNAAATNLRGWLRRGRETSEAAEEARCFCERSCSREAMSSNVVLTRTQYSPKLCLKQLSHDYFLLGFAAVPLSSALEAALNIFPPRLSDFSWASLCLATLPRHYSITRCYLPSIV